MYLLFCRLYPGEVTIYGEELIVTGELGLEERDLVVKLGDLIEEGGVLGDQTDAVRFEGFDLGFQFEEVLKFCGEGIVEEDLVWLHSKGFAYVGEGEDSRIGYFAVHNTGNGFLGDAELTALGNHLVCVAETFFLGGETCGNHI